MNIPIFPPTSLEIPPIQLFYSTDKKTKRRSKRRTFSYLHGLVYTPQKTSFTYGTVHRNAFK